MEHTGRSIDQVPVSTDSRPVDRRYIAGALIALGLFLVVTGPAAALITLLASVSVEPGVSSSGADALSTVHVVGLLAGLVGGILLTVGLVWLLAGIVRARRHRVARSAR